MIDTLAELFAMCGVPGAIRSDNGPELVAAIQRWLGQVDIETRYIAPGTSWENGYAENPHRPLRDEFLAVEVFESLAAARRLAVLWRKDYNQVRPHSLLEYASAAATALYKHVVWFLKLRDHDRHFPLGATFLWHVAGRHGLVLEMTAESDMFLFRLPERM